MGNLSDSGNRPKIDPATALKIHGLLNKCATEGRDAIRAMDELGYLMFQDLEAWLRSETLGAASVLLDLLSIDAIVKGQPMGPFNQPQKTPQTPHETKQLIVDWLTQLAHQQLVTETHTEENPPT